MPPGGYDRPLHEPVPSSYANFPVAPSNNSAPPASYANVPVAPSNNSAPPASYANVPVAPSNNSAPPASYANVPPSAAVAAAPGPAPAPAPAQSSTEAKRQKIMSRIPKTKTHDSEGGDLGFAAEDDAPLVGKKLVSKYQGEDKGLTWRAGSKEEASVHWGLDVGSPEFEEKWQRRLNSDRLTTRYDTTPEARERSLLKERGSGKVKATHDKRSYSSSDESGWVMDPSSGNIHTFDPGLMGQDARGKKKTNHHSSPLAGGNVAGAGMMKFEDKHITEVTDESGHYRPEGEYTYQAVKAMAARGLLDREADEDDVDDYEAGEGNLSAKVSLGGFVPNDPRQHKGWLKHERGIDKGKLTLPYQAFLQTHGNERQARAKRSMQAELLRNTPEVAEDPSSKAMRKRARPASSLGDGAAGGQPVQAQPPVVVEDDDQALFYTTQSHS